MVGGAGLAVGRGDFNGSVLEDLVDSVVQDLLGQLQQVLCATLSFLLGPIFSDVVGLHGAQSYRSSARCLSALAKGTCSFFSGSYSELPPVQLSCPKLDGQKGRAQSRKSSSRIASEARSSKMLFLYALDARLPKRNQFLPFVSHAR